MKYSLIKLIALFMIAMIFSSCSPKIPEGATAIQNFELDRYLGTWYEIARLDYKWEKNMNNVTANYSLNDEGNVKVLNKGYDYVDKKWKQSEGEAKFVNSTTEGRLKVSFFKPFWAGYNVVDQVDYQYALVIGDTTENAWILSRTKTIPDEMKTRFLEKAKSIGVSVDELIWVEQNK